MLCQARRVCLEFSLTSNSRGFGFLFCFQEDLGEKVVQDDVLPGHVGSACLLSSTIAELGKSAGVLTLAIMSRNPRKTIGKVRGTVDASNRCR